MEKKTILITNYDLLNIIVWFDDENGWYKSTKLPISIRRMCKNIIKKLNELKSNYDEDEKDALGEYRDSKHSDPIKGDSGLRKVKKEYLSEFNKARLELLSIKSELEFIPLPHSAFDDMDILDKDYRILDLFLDE